MNQTTLKSPPEASGKLGWGVRFAYGCGDTACNLVFGMMSTILTLFYTDYAGIPAATVGLVMLLSRVFDGVSDMIMGVVVEHTHSKWGKSRPWLLWMSVPFAISAVLLFTVPHTTAFLQFLYIFVTYNFCTTVCYTAINLPYGSLSAMMTRDSDERAYLSIVRMGLSPFGRILAVTVSLPLIQFFGNDQAAWVKTMSIWGVLAVILLVINFAFCKETVQIEAVKKQAKIPLGKSLKALVTNRYFWAVLILWAMQNGLFTFTGTSSRITAATSLTTIPGCIPPCIWSRRSCWSQAPSAARSCSSGSASAICPLPARSSPLLASSCSSLTRTASSGCSSAASCVPSAWRRSTRSYSACWATRSNMASGRPTSVRRVWYSQAAQSAPRSVLV